MNIVNEDIESLGLDIREGGSGYDQRENSMKTACWGLIVGDGLTGEKKKNT